jgi:hypothetical protein
MGFFVYKRDIPTLCDFLYETPRAQIGEKNHITFKNKTLILIINCSCKNTI